MDLSIIRCVKVQYRKALVLRLLAAIETKRSSKDELKQITVSQLQQICDIAAEILVKGGDKDEEVDDDEEEDTTDAKIPPTHTAALKALKTLRDFFQFNF
ncbi:hypothetical protein NPIL_52841 [Nephila pilipes]|uniref:Uncharacterized protein n=1 Tax=Nephila pilipes TaxID=299642 RepID=A0A8X6N9F9_NEPPI|nr:hypothetical protein NPIL_52841 [Nephila pilipes]